MKHVQELPTFDHAQTLPGIGFRLPARMSVLPLEAGQLALISPTPIDDVLAAKIATLGEVRFLIAPNLLHHLYLSAAMERYPDARVLAPAALRRKRPDLRVDAALEEGLPSELEQAVDIVQIEGAPGVDEFVFFHRETRTLIVTDLVFHVLRPEGIVAHIVLFLNGCHGRLASSRVWRLAIKDRASATRSVERILTLPATTLVMAHGEIVRGDVQARLAAALRWLLPVRPALPALS